MANKKVSLKTKMYQKSSLNDKNCFGMLSLERWFFDHFNLSLVPQNFIFSFSRKFFRHYSTPFPSLMTAPTSRTSWSIAKPLYWPFRTTRMRPESAASWRSCLGLAATREKTSGSSDLPSHCYIPSAEIQSEQTLDRSFHCLAQKERPMHKQD